MSIELHFVRRMLTIDPNYGSQEHQRIYIARLERLQSLQPCTHDHEHERACYAETTHAHVFAEFAPEIKHAAPLPVVAPPSTVVHSDLDGGMW